MTKKISWAVGKRELWAMVLGAFLYAGISAITSFAHIGDAFGGDVRPSVAIPIFFGFIFGPVVGFVTGFLGNFAFDLIGGWIHYPPQPATGSLLRDIIVGFLLNWEIGNGLFGLIPGLRALHHPSYRTWREQLWAFGYMAVAIVIGVGLPAFTDLWLYPDVSFTALFQPIVRVNLINATVLVPILLFNHERLDWRALNWRESALFRRFVLVILVSAALPTALLSVFLTQQAADAGTDSTLVSLQLALTILLAALFTLVNATILAQSVLRPLLALTDAAQAIKQNQYTSQQAAALRDTPGDQTEISYLRQLFGQMAEEVISREEHLRQQVTALQIMIDDAKRSEQVAEITDTDFFRELQVKAQRMRQRHAAANGYTMATGD